MNTLEKIISGAIISLIILVLGTFLLQSKSDEPPERAGDSFFGQIDVQSAVPVSDVSFRSGSVMIDMDKIKNNGLTFADPQNPGNYILAQDLGYCEDGYCYDNKESDSFSMWFDGRDQAFFIVLESQPLELARSDAEDFLQTLLGISNNDMCSISYYMTVSKYLESSHAGERVSFSFCSGARALLQ